MSENRQLYQYDQQAKWYFHSRSKHLKPHISVAKGALMDEMNYEVEIENVSMHRRTAFDQHTLYL